MKKFISQQSGAAHLLLIAAAVVVLAGVGFVIYRSQASKSQANVDKKADEVMKNVAESEGAADPNLVGSWQTACLVPDPNSPWAEKHQFVIEGDKATHTRWSDDTGANNCDKPNMTLVDKYTYAVPASGQINFNDTEKGTTFYDIYKVSSTSLEFGHGFRQSYAGANKISGESAANRIDTLNTYLAYTKK